jgi:hypothetical protein
MLWESMESNKRFVNAGKMPYYSSIYISLCLSALADEIEIREIGVGSDIRARKGRIKILDFCAFLRVVAFFCFEARGVVRNSINEGRNE